MTVNTENLHFYAWTSKNHIHGEIKAVVVDFPGLGYAELKSMPTTFDLELSANGILVITPFYHPWSWMNKEAQKLTDEIISAVFEVYGLSDDIPLILCGGSMGGLCALIYAIYGQKKPVACAVNCPVCDLPFHATERPDLPRTMYAAFSHYAGGIQEGLLLNSPLHQADKLPYIPYLFIHADKDPAVSNDRHSRPLIEKMSSLEHSPDYIVTRSDWHCAYNDYTFYRKTVDFIVMHAQK